MIDHLEEIERLKKRVEELETNQIQLDTLLDNIPIAIYFKDKNSKFIKASKFMADAFQVKSTTDMVGKSDFDYHFSEHANIAFNDEQNVMKTGVPIIDVIQKLVRRNGDTRWMMSTKFPLKDVDGTSIGIFGVGRDITAIKNMEFSLIQKNDELLTAEEELRQTIEELQCTQEELYRQKEHIEGQGVQILEQNKALEEHRNNLELLVEKRTKELIIAKQKAEESDRLKSAFLANMSHEIRTPMNSIIGFSRLLNTTDINTDEFENYINLIQSSADSLLTLIDDILDLSLIQANQLVIFKQDFNLNQLLEPIKAAYSLKVINPLVQFKVTNEVSRNEVIIHSDLHRMNQIVSNLLNNANKFTESGVIEVNVGVLGNYLNIQVTDSGIGIANERLTYIFERFTKVEDNISELYRGAGLGLAISSNIAKQLGCELKVSSIVGKGSKFILKIPLNIVGII